MVSITTVNISYNELSGPLPNTKAFEDASIDTLKNNTGLCSNNFRALKPEGIYFQFGTLNTMLAFLIL
ncbi:hypothetical protein MKW92_020919, partial [Papaver armeniacum]